MADNGLWFFGRRITEAERVELDEPEDGPVDLGPRVGARSATAVGAGPLDDDGDLRRARVSAGGTTEKCRAKCLGCGAPVELAQGCMVRVTRCGRCAASCS